MYRNARYVNISLILVGCPVTLKVKSGDVFHGILTAFSPDVSSIDSFFEIFQIDCLLIQ